MAELEKLGRKFRIALKIAKDPRIKRMTCQHKGTYADDCLVNRCTEHRCYIVATCDRDLKRRIRKVPGVPIMYVQMVLCGCQYSCRMPVSPSLSASIYYPHNGRPLARSLSLSLSLSLSHTHRHNHAEEIKAPTRARTLTLPLPSPV
jgi:hypothetical protein